MAEKKDITSEPAYQSLVLITAQANSALSTEELATHLDLEETRLAVRGYLEHTLKYEATQEEIKRFKAQVLMQNAINKARKNVELCYQDERLNLNIEYTFKKIGTTNPQYKLVVIGYDQDKENKEAVRRTIQIEFDVNGNYKLAYVEPNYRMNLKQPYKGWVGDDFNKFVHEEAIKIAKQLNIKTVYTNASQDEETAAFLNDIGFKPLDRMVDGFGTQYLQNNITDQSPSQI